MKHTSIPSDPFTASQHPSVVRVTIPDVTASNAVAPDESVVKLVSDNSQRIDALQQAIDQSTQRGDRPPVVAPAPPSDPQNLKNNSVDPAKKQIDGLVDSILQRFPLAKPVTLVFVGCKTDSETDEVTSNVAQRLAERRVGRVLLVDANTKSKSLSSDLGFATSDGIGNVVCDQTPWKNTLQSGPTDSLDFLPYGNANTAKVLRSQTAEFLDSTKETYQFICVSAGLNDDSFSKSFCSAAEGIYLLIDVNQVTDDQAKLAVEKLKTNNQQLIGCIALDAQQESQ